MATVSKWTPFGVALDITATGGTVTRTSATKFTVNINVSWETYYSGAQTNYGMTASSGGVTSTISAFSGAKRSSGSGSFTGTYSISGNGAATKTIAVTFRNFNDDNGDSATKTVSFNVSVPAWTSYTVSYNANGGTGAPSKQTKWKDQALTLSATKPTRTGYSFLGWSTSSTATSASYSAGASYTNNSSVTLYAVWKANTYVVKYNANGGTGAPGNQTKTYGVALTLSTTKPTRTNYTFLGWATSATATASKYSAGGSYTANAAVTLYAVWQLSYKKPSISNLSAVRCDTAGNATENGTCALVSFKWETYQNVSAITINFESTDGSETDSVSISSSGTSGTVSKIINYEFNLETTYAFIVTVRDKESTERTTSMSGLIFNIDFHKDQSTSIGKPAEQLYDEKGKVIRAFDVNWRSKFRNHVGIGEKIGHLDGKTGIFLSAEGYMHIQRSTAQSYHPYIGFFFDDSTSAAGTIRLNSTSKKMEFLSALGYLFAHNIEMTSNNKAIYGVDPSGASKNCFIPQNDNGNTVIGYGNYAANDGNTNIYGKDLNFGISNVASGSAYFCPYFKKGDSTSLKNTLCLSGFVTAGGTDVYFTIPFAKPIVGSPTATLTSIDGFRLRQNDKYTHGSASDKWVTPTSYSATVVGEHAIGVKVVFSNTTNCINNAPIGIQWSGTITFS